MNSHELAIEKLKNFMKTSGRTQGEISRAIGMSAAAISQFLSGQYTGDNEGLADKINKYILQEQNKIGMPELPPFALTKAAKQVFLAADYAYIHNEITLVYGRAGVGKTMAIQEYMKNHAGIVYVVIRDCDNSINAACKRILKALDRRAKGTKSDLMDTILEILGDAGRLLIIDEAQHLSSKAIDNLRSLNDEGNIPMMLVGNPTIYGNVFQEDDLDQIYSRIGMIQEIKDKPLLKDIENIFSPFQLDKECIQALHSIACRKGGKGGLRHMIKKYRAGVIYAASKHEIFSIQHLKTIEGDML